MDIVNLGKARHFLQAKAVNLGIIDRPHMVCELLCLTPGQREERRTQDNCDELYLVIEGHASLGIGSVLHELEALDAVVAPPGVDRWLANEDEVPLTVLAVMAPNPKHVSIRPPQRLQPRRMASVPRDEEPDIDLELGDDDEDADERPPRPVLVPRPAAVRPTMDRGPRDARGPARSGMRSDRPPSRPGPVRGSAQRPHFEDNERDERNSIPDERGPRRDPAANRPRGAAGRFANTRAPRFGGGAGRPGPGAEGRSGPSRSGARPSGPGGRSFGGRPAGPRSFTGRPGDGEAEGRPSGPPRGRSAGGSRPAGPGPRGGGSARTGAPRSGPPRGRADGPSEAGARRFGPPRGASGDAYAPPRGRGASSRPPSGSGGRPRGSSGGGPGGARPRQSGRPGPGRSGPRPSGPR